MIRVTVNYFDENEKTKLLNYPTSNRIIEVVANGIIVPKSQFLTYYLFHKKRPGKPGYRNYSELSNNISKAQKEIEDWVHIQNGNILSVPDAVPQDRVITERIGEAISLSVISHIHDLHDADWDKIPERRGRGAIKTFDYQRNMVGASDGKYVVQIEAKGSSVIDTSVITPAIKTHKRNIDLKKSEIRVMEKEEGKYNFPADLRYGTICAIGYTGPVSCWLVDPPAETNQDPRRFRLLARLQYMYDWISFLSSRSQLAASLATRLEALKALDDPFQLAGVPLLRGNGQKYKYDIFDIQGPSLPLFNRLSRVMDGPAVGTILKLRDGRLFFIGIQRHIFEKVVNQDFESIFTYKDIGGSVSKKIKCVISRGRAERMGLTNLADKPESNDYYITFSAKGELHYSQGGSVFGIVEKDKGN